MPSPFACSHCDFDFGVLPERIELTLGAADSAAVCQVSRDRGGVANLRCPACGESVPLTLGSLGVIIRGTGAKAEFARWRTDAAPTRSPVMTLGRLELRFDRMSTMDPRDACFERVPVFRDESRATCVPDLPLKPEFFDCLDVVKCRAHLETKGRLTEVVGSMCRVTLYLNGLDRPALFDLPIQQASPGAVSIENAFGDVNIKIWPRVEIKGWSYYLVGASGIGEAGEALIRQGRLLFQAHAPGQAWVKLGADVPVQRAGGAVVQRLKARPDWVAVECADYSAGGIWSVPAVGLDQTFSPGTDEAQLGLDFGTSNSCVAFWDDEAQVARTVPAHPDELWNQYVLRAGSELTAVAGPDLWPAASGFGQELNAFASELLLPVTRKEFGVAIESIDKWLYGIHYGVPGKQKPLFPESDHVVRHFKWATMLGQAYGGAIKERVAEIQASYLAGILMNSYVRSVLSKHVASRRVSVKYSYPMAFEEQDANNLKRAAEAARKLLTEWTGASWTLTQDVDESTAAARVAGDRDCTVHVFLDMGGGSTDVAIRVGHLEKNTPPQYLTSVQYAGTAAIDSFTGRLDDHTRRPVGSCLAPNVGLGDLHRRIREARSAKDVLEDRELFSRQYARTTENRLNHFYFYLTEYVARLLAAGLIERRLLLESQPVQIGFYFLGNGWGFASALVATKDEQSMREMIATRIFDRMKELLVNDPSEEAQSLEAAMPALPTFEAVKLRAHPKAAVACGLLRSAVATSESAGGKRRGIVGLTTKVGTRLVPWFALYDNSKHDPTQIVPNLAARQAQAPPTGPQGGPPGFGPPPFGGPPPFAPAVQHQYYAHVNGGQQGPVSFDQLKQVAMSGQLTSETPIWRNGLTAWGPASAVPELASIFAPPVAPPPFGGPPAFGGPPPFGGPPASPSAAPEGGWRSTKIVEHAFYRKIENDPLALSWPTLDPGFPGDLTPPLELKEGVLNDVRPQMRSESMKLSQGWFTKGPYEVMLEVLIKPNLGRVN